MKRDWKPHVCTIYRQEVWGCECNYVATAQRVDEQGKVWRIAVILDWPHQERESRATLVAAHDWEVLYGDQPEDLERLNRLIPRDEWPRECWNSTGDCGTHLREIINRYHQERE